MVPRASQNRYFVNTVAEAQAMIESKRTDPA